MRININKQGITLIEIVVSVAILAILSLMLIMIMSAALSGIKTTHDRTNKAMNAASQIESQRAADSYNDSSSSSVVLEFSTPSGTSTYTVDGKYATDRDGTYTEFVPD